MKKRGTIVTLSLCLVGAAGFSALYAVNKVEKAKEQQERLKVTDRKSTRLNSSHH